MSEDKHLLKLLRHGDSFALRRLYEMYYECILGFCVYRLFNKEITEDVTSAVFLEVARSIGVFRGWADEKMKTVREAAPVLRP